MGCDGIWEGGDFNDDRRSDQQEGISVVKYVGEQLEQRLQNGNEDREKVAKEIVKDLVSQIVSRRSPD